MRRGGLWLGLILLAQSSVQVHASDVDALKAQVEALREDVARQEAEATRRQTEEARQRDRLLNTIEQLEQRMEGLAPSPGTPTATTLAPDAARTDAMERAVRDAQLASVPHAASDRPAFLQKDRPDLLDRALQRAGVTLPERDASTNSRHQALRRKTASGRYADPSSFFLLHGYTTLTYADFEDGFGTAPEAVPQILVSGTSTRSGVHEAGFRNDSALFIGSELNERLKAVLELHNVGNARDPVVTEAKFIWEPYEAAPSNPSLRLVGGRYWAPFGNHDVEWLSAANPFNLLSPAATEVVPPHWNEVGVMAEGEWPLAQQTGINYLLSLGNGINGFDLDDNVGGGRTNQFDQDSNLTLTSRIGVWPGIDNLEIGGSIAYGDMRQGTDTSYAATDARRYEADLLAFGVDMTYQFADLALRGYWYFSTEDLVGAPTNQLERNGGTLDVVYTFLHDAPLFKEVAVKGRAATAQDATLAAGTFHRSQYGFGFNARPHEHFLLKAEYFIQDESGIDDIKDNGFTLGGTVEF